MPRKRPYTQIGVRRLMCFRCKTRRAEFQWQICADGNVFRPLCPQCDVDLNEMVLRWVGDPEAEAKLRAYRQRVNV